MNFAVTRSEICGTGIQEIDARAEIPLSQRERVRERESRRKVVSPRC